MTGPPRDWDKEMAEIDKLMAKQPAAPAPSPPALRAAAVPASRPVSAAPVAVGRDRLTTWVRVLLGIAVAAGVTLAWPYAHVCGLPLYGYLAALAGVVVAGLWGVVHSWKRRLALAHVISLLVTLWGALLLGKATLDRTGYPRHPAAWKCP
ncbi:MAG TPA: hypothetical protein VGP61_01705 [Gemmatimonadales bacterium]|jgi:hypothetical protein|nr:hypothetical protein [Gemmatimonadales bacterium]